METADKYCCRTLPMRNWYETSSLSSASAYSRRTLPMRNWYRLSFHFCQLHISSDITYEELIRLIVSYLDVSYRWEGRTLPMRNWYVKYYSGNISSYRMSDITYEELIHVLPGSAKVPDPHGRTLPMRNWYMLPSNIRLANVPVVFLSDITYEELILKYYCYSFVFFFWLLRRTLPMRNWYLWRLILKSLVQFCLSDITYEELIQSSLTNSTIESVSRRTLPMRNWYIRCHQVHTLILNI